MLTVIQSCVTVNTEAYNVAEKTANIIKDPALLKTPKADDFISNLDTDEVDNTKMELRT